MWKDHSEMVRTLSKPGEAILESLTPRGVNLWHMATGISGESGELLDAIKKVAVYNKPEDLENLKEELGDLEFYLEGLRQELGVTREETLQGNMAKLSKRYGANYSDAAAQARVDKQGENGTGETESSGLTG